MLHERKVPVLLLTVPVNHATYGHLLPQFRDQFADYLRTRAEHFDNVIVSEPTFSCWPDALYGDAAHFNAAGADALSRQLSEMFTHILAGTEAGRLPDRCSDAK
jgi:hypothetical protein